MKMNFKIGNHGAACSASADGKELQGISSISIKAEVGMGTRAVVEVLIPDVDVHEIDGVLHGRYMGKTYAMIEIAKPRGS